MSAQRGTSVRVASELQQLLRALTHALKLQIDGICLVSPCTLAVAGLVDHQKGIRTRKHRVAEGRFTNLMKKCVDEDPGNGTFIAPDAPCPVLAVAVGFSLGLDACMGSDLGAEVVLFSVCCGLPAVMMCCTG